MEGARGPIIDAEQAVGHPGAMRRAGTGRQGWRRLRDRRGVRRYLSPMNDRISMTITTSPTM